MLWVVACSLLVAVALGILLAVWIRWLWKRTPAPRWVLIATGVLAVLPLVAGMLGTVLDIITSFGAVAGESVDPSQKARILAEGISEAMNCTAFVIFLALVMLPSVLSVLTWKYHWSKAKKTPPTP